MKCKKLIEFFSLVICMCCFCGCFGDNKKNVSSKPDIEYNEEGCSTLVQYEVKGDKSEIVYNLEIINNTDETKYFYLYANMAQEDDNLVIENTIPGYEKDTEEKQVYQLEPHEGKDDYFTVYFRGTHGSQDTKENKKVIQEKNLIIKEIAKEDIPENAKVVTLDEE